MSKFSVRKPFTVFVAVVLILITGVVSYTKMTPDLLPDIDMPYVVVMTPYPGATPEKVETSVTKPIEQNMATLTDIKNIQSVSNSNYSMVMMEFEETVNMDTIATDILQKINLVEGNWDDMVGTPTILKINPNMIPIRSAAVGYKGMNRAELSEFVSDTLMGKLEGITGVASVSASGILEEKVNVVISQEKIDNINNEILAQVNASLASAQNELDKNREELEKGKAGVEEARANLEQLKAMLPEEQYNAQKEELDKSEKELSKAEKQLDSAQTKLDAQAAQARADADIGDKITSDMIVGILKGQNFSMPAGYIEEKGVSYLVSVGDNITTEKQAEKLYLFDTGVSSVGKVYLKDVADIFVSNNADDIYAKVNGEDGIVLLFSKQSNYATAEVSNNIEEKFLQLEGQYDGLEFTNLMDQGEYIDLIVKSIFSSLLWGALFACIILFLFLRSLKPTIITICSIPISITAAVVLMYFTGISINLISMSGLAVSVGMLVDNSVVVIENIVRLRRQGIPAPKAAVAGAKQVSAAITGSTLTTVCVFVPIVFTTGITRELFTDMALTVTFTLMASLLIALTLVPSMASRMLVNVGENEGRFYNSIVEKYEKTLIFMLNHKLPILIVTIALLGGSIYGAYEKGFIFMPEMSAPQLQATMEMPKDSTVKEIREEADKANKLMGKVKEVETVGTIVNDSQTQMMGGGAANSASFYIILNRDMERTSSEIGKEIEEKCSNLKGTVSVSGNDMTSYTSALGGNGVEVKVYSSDIDDLQASAKKIASKLENVEGIGEVSNGIEESDREYHFKVKKTEAMKKGLTVAQVYSAIVDAMTYEDTATSVTWKGNEYDVIVSSEKKDALTPEEMKTLVLSVEGADGSIQEVELSDIAELVEKDTLKSIRRDNQRRYLTVSATLKDGYNITKVAADAEKAVDKCKLPAGTSVEFAGENETIMESMKDLFLMLALGILFVYLVMVAQFQSLKSPFIIMFTIPLAFTGGLLTLLLFGKEISVIAMLGMIMLTGIIVNNGIVLVDYINQLREQGLTKREAIVGAAKTRIRPILMTSVTTILGLVVMALGNSTGTDMMQPIALVCIGGLTYATLLTLYIVPIIYDIMNGEEYKFISEEELT
ncbi:MAG: efflux RND transporter permease subunit [Eubacteriaceae bacterium]|nr:efflux RND transporter permease subunit [Eubacteriaceae bacterium]